MTVITHFGLFRFRWRRFVACCVRSWWRLLTRRLFGWNLWHLGAHLFQHIRRRRKNLFRLKTIQDPCCLNNSIFPDLVAAPFGPIADLREEDYDLHIFKRSHTFDRGQLSATTIASHSGVNSHKTVRSDCNLGNWLSQMLAVFYEYHSVSLCNQ